MATIVNTPPVQDNSSGPMSMILVFVVLLVLGYLAFVFGLPALRQMRSGTEVNVEIPDQIDVNVNQGQ